ncbi:MAG: hypothetical protein ACI9N9_000077 [Enterobacterales bacterium]|jgi:hypothetical protein
MKKRGFKVGDKVEIMNVFKEGYLKHVQGELIVREGRKDNGCTPVSNKDGGILYVCSYKLQHIEEFVNGQEVEVRDTDSGKWSKKVFIGIHPSEGKYKHVVANGSNVSFFQYCRAIPQTKIITLDGKDIELSIESYNAFVEQFKS